MIFASMDVIGIVAICVPVGGAFLTAMVIGVAHAWRRAKVSEYRAVLVQNMIDKGFGPEEIERVLKANDTARETMSCKMRKRREEAAC